MLKHTYQTLFCSISLIFISHLSFASPLPIESFSQKPSVEKFQISPSGNKIVYIRNTYEKGISFIVMIDMLKGEKKVLGLTDNHGEHFKWLRWANEDIILAGIRVKTYREGTRLQESRLYKFHADGSKKGESIYSRRIFKISKRKWNPVDQDNIIDLLPDDPEHVLIQMKIHERYYPSVFKLNVNDGSVKTIKKPNKEAYTWMTDQQHNVRLGFSFNYKIKKQKIWLKSLADGDWDILWEYDYGTIDSVEPKGFDLDGNILYFTKYYNDKLALYTLNLTTKDETLIFSDPKYDVTGSLIYSPDTHDVVGFYHEPLPTGRYYLDETYKDEQHRIDKILTTTTNYILSTSDDLDTYIVYADAANTPGTYYLGKKKDNTLTRLFSNYPNLDPKQMIGSDKISYTARDGTEIEAYLSKPLGTDKPIATIIHPHGGPGSRNYGVFDVWTEFLVNRGYAVLRPNFRGSTGYGFNFQKAQEGAWGMSMQDDITDGVKWLIDNKIADPSKICIFGASYGGYAALMGAVKTPDLFQCAISFAGVTDIVALRNEYRRMKNYKLVKQQLGSNDKEMEANSPRYRAKEINIPILLLHGDEDKVVEIEQSQWMAEELKRANKTFKFVELPDGDHQMSIQSNRNTVFQEVGDFLEQYLEN